MGCKLWALPTMTPYLSIEKAKAEFESFLFAPIGEESNGMTLSVLSGLSRLDVDPWDEAAWLSQQTKAVAIAQLAQRIARMPRGKWQLSETIGIASRLVELLPKHRAESRSCPADLPTTKKKRPASIALWLIAAGMALSLLFGAPGRVERLLIGDSVAPVVTPAASSAPAP